ncbi:hypothetical protein BHE74_00021373 [Ensete ventricosum]|nr:hypothetical protein BHE74_00021373 [Ensete ventricosum]
MQVGARVRRLRLTSTCMLAEDQTKPAAGGIPSFTQNRSFSHLFTRLTYLLCERACSRTYKRAHGGPRLSTDKNEGKSARAIKTSRWTPRQFRARHLRPYHETADRGALLCSPVTVSVLPAFLPLR